MNTELAAYRKEQLANLNDTIALTLEAYWGNSELLAADLANDDVQHEDLVHNVESLLSALRLAHKSTEPSYL